MWLCVTLLASRHVTVEGGGAAALDGRHDFELGEAQMAGPGLAPGGRQGSRAELLQRALDGAQGGAGDTGVARGGIEFAVAQEHLDHPDVDLLLEQMGSEAVP